MYVKLWFLGVVLVSLLYLVIYHTFKIHPAFAPADYVYVA